MRCCSRRFPRWGTVVVAVGVLACSPALAGCSHGARGGRITPSPARPSGTAGVPDPAPPGAIGLSPGGVTTRVDVPADSTEEQYFQACHAAKVWMDAQPNTGESRVESYLAMVQASPSGTPGTWNAPWARLSLPRQAAVIVAARAAANDECG
ncbi:lipoprotein LpqV [Mycobacterium helveticum]|uniref:Lipoprotein LpqV n=1 Tax=Mycobacterium helveticum TaxID=2592811 RepID=A0A557XTB3_9MYCO|nr:lipoprotein LpqV [Mycobacterium helveticum]TVS89203.1 hypothetical protein FPZ47_12465 [Mycobacterium helveticum]TVS89831.1 hypothetical protein FPZ46_00765 [Mycobacterium helveticum]